MDVWVGGRLQTCRQKNDWLGERCDYQVWISTFWNYISQVTMGLWKGQINFLQEHDMTTWAKQNHPPEKTNERHDGDNRHVSCVPEERSLTHAVVGPHTAGLAAFVTVWKWAFLSSCKQLLQYEVRPKTEFKEAESNVKMRVPPGDKDMDFGLLGCNAMWTYRQTPKFRRSTRSVPPARRWWQYVHPKR